MTHGKFYALLAAAACAAGALAGSADYVFNVDPNQSYLVFTVEALGFQDSDASPADGTVDATLTPEAGLFTEIHVTAMAVDLTQTLYLVLNGGILGRLDITGNDLGLRMGNGYGWPGDPAPVAIDGSFLQAANLIEGVGQLDYVGTGILFGGIGSGSVNMQDLGAFVADLEGTVIDDGQTVTLTMPIYFTGSYPIEGIEVHVTVTGMIVGTAPTQEVPTPGDMDCDGDVDFDDIDAFVQALESQAGYEAVYPDCRYLNADTDGDGDVDFDDIDPFVVLLGG